MSSSIYPYMYISTYNHSIWQCGHVFELVFLLVFHTGRAKDVPVASKLSLSSYYLVCSIISLFSVFTSPPRWAHLTRPSLSRALVRIFLVVFFFQVIKHIIQVLCIFCSPVSFQRSIPTRWGTVLESSNQKQRLLLHLVSRLDMTRQSVYINLLYSISCLTCSIHITAFYVCCFLFFTLSHLPSSYDVRTVALEPLLLSDVRSRRWWVFVVEITKKIYNQLQYSQSHRQWHADNAHYWRKSNFNRTRRSNRNQLFHYRAQE